MKPWVKWPPWGRSWAETINTQKFRTKYHKPKISKLNRTWLGTCDSGSHKTQRFTKYFPYLTHDTIMRSQKSGEDSKICRGAWKCQRVLKTGVSYGNLNMAAHLPPTFQGQDCTPPTLCSGTTFPPGVTQKCWRFVGKVCGSPYLQPRYLHSIAALDNLRYTCCLDRIQEPAIEIFMNPNTFINHITEKEAPAALLCCKSFLTRSVPSQVFGEPSPPESTPTFQGHPECYFCINDDI